MLPLLSHVRQRLIHYVIYVTRLLQHPFHLEPLPLGPVAKERQPPMQNLGYVFSNLPMCASFHIYCFFLKSYVSQLNQSLLLPFVSDEL